MQVTVFGASGRVGRLVVADLLASGYQVVAFVHKTNPFTDNPEIKVVQGSINDIDPVNQAIQGSGAVISALGSWGSSNNDVVSSGGNLIIQAMTQQDVRRLITLTGASAFYSQDKPGVFARLTRLILSLFAPKILKDGENHLRSLEASSLDWTCVRSPVMTGSSNVGYRLSEELPTLLAAVPRQAVVNCLIDQLTDTKFIRKAPVIYRG